jgi:outer membrane lipoprotein-sorting protein
MKLLPEGTGGATLQTDGTGKARVTLPGKRSEKTIVADGSTLWVWDSQSKTVTKRAIGDVKKDKPESADPAALGKTLLDEVRKYSDVKVDGTARVASRPAYELVLTPKPTERTLLREVRVAVDSETKVPLRVQVLANGQSAPALKVAFTEFTPGAQDANLFTFTPPQGATVKEEAEKSDKPADHKGFGDLFGKLNPQVVGDGWDTTVVAKLPSDLGSLTGQGGEAPWGGKGKGGNFNPTQLLKQFGKEVSGPFGTGYVFNTKVATALVTTDGRVALGAVPEQVLIEALGQVK